MKLPYLDRLCTTLHDLAELGSSVHNAPGEVEEEAEEIEDEGHRHGEVELDD